MSRMKNAVKLLGDFVGAVAEHEHNVRELTTKLVSKTDGVSYEDAEKIARALIANAEEIVWK